MPNIQSASPIGDMIQIQYDDQSTDFGYPDGRGGWIFSADDTDTTPGDTSTGATAGTGTYYLPWPASMITGTWADHMSYSAGGIDYGYGYGSPIYAPAPGTLHTTGGSGEYAVNWQGSAGRRSILYLDADIPRIAGRALDTKEGSGSLHAIVFQHQSAFGTDLKHYTKGQVVGKTGASADGSNYGGDIHLHVHGLNAAGDRLNILNFLS